MKSEKELNLPSEQPLQDFNLSYVVERHPSSLESRAKLASILHDLYPKEHYKTNLVLAVYDCGIANRIRTAKDLNSQLVGAFVRQLESDWGMKPENALQGVELWANAYHKQVFIENEKSSVNEPILQQESPIAEGICVIHCKTTDGIVEGPLAEYSLDIREEGVYIEQFLGFDANDMVVPNMIDQKRIVGIGKKAYQNCTILKHLTISEGIRYIDEGAFYGCESLEKVSFSSTVQRIGYKEDEHKKSYRPSLPLFEGCGSLKLVELNDGVKIIGKSAFSGLSIATEQPNWNVVLPTSVQEIDRYAFRNCTALKYIQLNDGLKVIEDRAFFNCCSLEQLTLPSTVWEIGWDAFYSCESLTRCKLSEGLEVVHSPIFNECKSLENIVVPGTTRIPDDIFGDDTSLANLTIYCQKDSAAFEFAKKHGYAIKSVEEWID